MPHPRLIALLGTLLTAAYAAWAAVQILVLNPLAAAPGRSLDQVHADVAAAGESLGEAWVLAILVFGVVLAVILAAHHWNDRSTRSTAVSYLLLLVIGTPAYWVASFGAGMALADTYGTTGADHSSWAWPLYAISGLALVALIVALTQGALVRRRRTLAP